MARYGQNSFGSGQAIVEGSCPHCNEPLDSIKTLGISRVTEHLLTSQKGLGSMGLIC